MIHYAIIHLLFALITIVWLMHDFFFDKTAQKDRAETTRFQIISAVLLGPLLFVVVLILSYLIPFSDANKEKP